VGCGRGLHGCTVLFAQGVHSYKSRSRRKGKMVLQLKATRLGHY